ncbi:hypothetical protein BHE74_00002855 [Ensete ventricosum]|nr:hypothetical protein BHE74_00002855 [Ensete ventricosum]
MLSRCLDQMPSGDADRAGAGALPSCALLVNRPGILSRSLPSTAKLRGSASPQAVHPQPPGDPRQTGREKAVVVGSRAGSEGRRMGIAGIGRGGDRNRGNAWRGLRWSRGTVKGVFSM